jgi:UDP-2,4-diacetamido-2,4,6-trideoxy-beta-L-altropyranose hydrolase
MIVLMRADATAGLGTGHVMRCAALGLRLAGHGAQVHFACAALPPAIEEWLCERGFGVHLMEGIAPGDEAGDLRQSASLASALPSIDLLVVDNYGLGYDWEHGMRAYAARILVIDDLADRDHDCDLLLDQNLRHNAAYRYTNRVPSTARQFIGPRYALLRPEFDDPGLLRRRDGIVRRLLVFFGGTDPGNQSGKLLEALSDLGSAVPASTVVLGPAHPDRESAHQSAASLPNVILKNATTEMARLMSEADLAIGTCGIAAWERCLLGVPSLVVVTAENQREDAEILDRLGAVKNLGDAEAVTARQWTDALRRAMDDQSGLKAMGLAALAVMHERQRAIAELESAVMRLAA